MTLYDYCKEQLENISDIKYFEYDGKRYRDNELDSLKLIFGIFESELYEDEYLDYDGTDENGPIYLKFRWLVCKIKRSTMFIKTKKAIYKVLDVDFKNNTKVYHTATETFTKRLVLKEADTIEELCDGFVTVGNKHIVWDKQHCLGLTFEQVKESYSAYHFKIYGAIWTDTGLKYIAKMNEKGELELI